ncbi:MAG: hypothetical protein J6W29_00905 [Neisseriaceae bacterium]|nr:hypothetical protein [Neisseriaceae bacterium]
MSSFAIAYPLLFYRSTEWEILAFLCICLGACFSGCLKALPVQGFPCRASRTGSTSRAGAA